MNVQRVHHVGDTFDLADHLLNARAFFLGVHRPAQKHNPALLRVDVINAAADRRVIRDQVRCAPCP